MEFSDKFTLLTLQPKDKEDRVLYRNFKMKQIRLNLVLWGCMIAIIWVFNLILYLATLNSKTFRFFITGSVASILWLLVTLVRNHGDYFVYLMPPARVIISIVFFWGVISKETDFDEKCDYKAIAPIIMEEMYIFFTFLLELMFFSPSLKMSLLTYSPIYVIT